MAKVMLRELDGKIFFYIAKKDMEETIKSLEFDTDELWGGEVVLNNGDIWWIKPGAKKLPKEEICKKIFD